MMRSELARGATALARCVVLCAALASCSRRDPDAVDRWNVWERASEIVFVVPPDRRAEAERALPSLQRIFAKPLRLAGAIPADAERTPLLVWNEFTAPLAHPSIAWSEPLAVSTALERFGRSGEREQATFWAWASAEPDLGRRYSLAARALDEVPWELLRVERHTGAGYQCFRRGELTAEGPLLARGDSWHLENLRVLETRREPLREGAWSTRGIRVESAPLMSEAQRLAVDTHLRNVVDPFATSPASSAEVRLVLHRDPESMRRACGFYQRELVVRGSRTVHWLVGEEPFVLPSCFELQKLRLKASAPSPVRSWWLEGLSTLLLQRHDAFDWPLALPLLAAEPSRPRARDLFDEARFASAARWQRRAASALLIWQAFAQGLDVSQLADLGPETPGWPWIADQILEHGIARKIPQHERVGRDSTPLFARTIAIEPAFPRGYFDARYRGALERARDVGADTILLVLRDRPAEQSAASRAWPRRDSIDELAFAVAEAHRAGFRVRLRLRWQEARIGGTFGGIWTSSERFWTSGLERYERWLREVVFASRSWPLDALHIGFELHGMFEPTRNRSPRLALAVRRAVDAAMSCSAAPVIFEFKTRERFGEASFLRAGERVAVGTRDFLHGMRDRVEPLTVVRDPRAARFFPALPHGPSQRVSKIALEDGLSGVDLIVAVHGHARAALYPQWPLPGPATALQQFLLEAHLRLALGNPLVRGVILEGGECEGDHAPLELGFGDPALAELLKQSLRALSIREALRWILPLGG